jgi:hypothetical protein
MDLLAHLPPLPLVIDYRNSIAAEDEENSIIAEDEENSITAGDEENSIAAKDEENIISALQQHGRVRHIVLQAPSQILHKSLLPMDGLFARLEHLSVLSTSDQDSNLILPETLRAPNLQLLSLLGVGLPTGLSLLTSTVSLVILSLTHIRLSGYFRPEHLATHLQHLTQLEELSIGFSIPIPRPNAEGELLRGPIIRVMVPSLRQLIFRGVGAYLDSLIARISAPRLERLSITLFNQLAFTLPHLSHFTNTVAGLRQSVANVSFTPEGVSIFIRHPEQPVDRVFTLTVNCREFDWQIDSAAQVCSVLMPALSVIEYLGLDLDQHTMPFEWQNAVDSVVWRELLLPFRGVKRLRIGHNALAFELSCSLDSDDAGLIPDLLPDLRVLEVQLVANKAFSAFIDARQLANRPVRLSATVGIYPTDVASGLIYLLVPASQFLCPWPTCGGVYKRKQERDRHVVTRHLPLSLLCRRCGRRDGREDEHKKHLKSCDPGNEHDPCLLYNKRIVLGWLFEDGARVETVEMYALDFVMEWAVKQGNQVVLSDPCGRQGTQSTGQCPCNELVSNPLLHGMSPFSQ